MNKEITVNNEVFRPVPNFTNYYCSKSGKVLSSKSRRCLSPVLKKGVIPTLSLRRDVVKDGEDDFRQIALSSIVLNTWLEPIDTFLPEVFPVDFIDRDKHNCALDNLTLHVPKAYRAREAYKEIPHAIDYAITRTGCAKRKQGKFIRDYVSNAGYLQFAINKKSHTGTLSIHRAVAMTYIPLPNGRMAKECDKYEELKDWEVNHKDGNKLNNHYSNLEWCTRSENQQHVVDSELGGNRTKGVTLRHKDTPEQEFHYVSMVKLVKETKLPLGTVRRRLEAGSSAPINGAWQVKRSWVSWDDLIDSLTGEAFRVVIKSVKDSKDIKHFDNCWAAGEFIGCDHTALKTKIIKQSGTPINGYYVKKDNDDISWESLRKQRTIKAKHDSEEAVLLFKDIDTAAKVTGLPKGRISSCLTCGRKDRGWTFEYSG